MNVQGMNMFALGVIVGSGTFYLILTFLDPLKLSFAKVAKKCDCNMKNQTLFCLENLMTEQNDLSTIPLESLFEITHEIQKKTGEELYNQVSVLCWVMTGPENHKEKAIHVKRTWGQRCKKLLFMSSAYDSELGTIVLDGTVEGYNSLWQKTREAFKYIYENHFEEADWFMKADDDTYVIMENLRYLLKDYDPEYPIYFGHRMNYEDLEQGYMSGGAGYVLSKEALRRFMEDAYYNSTICRQFSTAEDLEMGTCLANVGVEAGDSRDMLGRQRNLPLAIDWLLVNNKTDPDFWYFDRSFYPQHKKLEMKCCSSNAISFHYITPTMMYVMEYLIYYFRPFGIQRIDRNTTDSPARK